MMSVRIMRRPLSYALLGILLFAPSASALEVPVNDGFVTDTIGLLTVDEEALLEDSLDAYARETSNEIAIVIVQSLSGAVIADEALNIGREWGVGGEDVNNGIVILVGYEDREVYMAVGYGLEGVVPDLVAYGIIQEDITPYFRDAQYYEGLAAAVDSLKKHIGGEYTAERYEEPESSGLSVWLLFFFFILLDWIAAMLARSKSWWLGGVIGGVLGIILTALYAWWISIPVLVIIGLIFDYIVSKGGGGKGGRGGRGGFGGFGGGSRSSSSFRGFSGGSFGGGGAGGRW